MFRDPYLSYLACGSCFVVDLYVQIALGRAWQFWEFAIANKRMADVAPEIYGNFGDYDVNSVLGGTLFQAHTKDCHQDFYSINVLRAVKQLIEKTRFKKGEANFQFIAAQNNLEPGLGPKAVPGVKLLLVAAAWILSARSPEGELERKGEKDGKGGARQIRTRFYIVGWAAGRTYTRPGAGTAWPVGGWDD
ncbi:hypothetical protein BS47DRAFT_1398428 [Hydnum rufescens UP504]|uniref:Uncharacterized protein n=1 Tax=Hydnum rufescens UP504 TaxID=1448309 RepID=A0A9P6DM77_9AGAM|nr:hypothetical protein BS47DRAFT_1398428 [Hydnum rufescens UP504]